MTVSSIITIARRFLQDTASPYRWENAELRNDIQLGIRELHKIRPETKYVDGALTGGVELPESDSDSIDIEDRFELALAYFTVYMAYLNDNSDTVNAQLAESYLSKFNTQAQL